MRLEKADDDRFLHDGQGTDSKTKDKHSEGHHPDASRKVTNQQTELSCRTLASRCERGSKALLPAKTTPVARILVKVVPNLLASRPPTSGVQVLLSENADMRRENSVLFVPISRERRDFRGPSMYEALTHQLTPSVSRWGRYSNSLVAPDA